MFDKVNTPQLPDAIPQRGNWLTDFLSKGYLALTGWRYEGTFPNIPQCVLIVVPHTSNWDFLIAMGAVFSLGLRISFMVKHTLFWEPFGTYLRWLGGIPINRKAAHGSVGEAVQNFATHPNFVLGITPEGTRSRVKRWKMGFYVIAREANVPILPVAFDYGRKVIAIGRPFIITGDQEADLAEIKIFYQDVRGKHPHEL